MRKGILLLFCVLLMVVVSTAQATYIKTLGESGDDVANAAIETRDGNYLLVGSTTSFGKGGSDGYISKVNGASKEIWDKTIGGSSDDILLNGIQLSNGDFILVGYSASVGNGGNDLLISKMDDFGNICWTKTFGGINDERGFSALETSDGNIIVAGESQSFGSGDLDVFVIKLASDGSEIWSKTYGTPANDWFSGEGLIEDSSGNYVLTGSWRNQSGGTGHDGFFMKVDVDGSILTLKGYGGNGDDGFNGLLRETNTGFQNIGMSWSWNGNNHEIWLSDLTPDGDLNWSKTIGLSGLDIRQGQIQFSDDGHYLISGYEFVNHNSGSGKAILAKISTQGDVIWAKSYGDTGLETLNAVFETDNGVIAFGATTSNGAGGEDVLIVRADVFGTVSGCSENINLTIADVIPNSDDPSFTIEDQSVSLSHTFEISNVDFVESVVCDGCDATDLTAGLFCETAPIICTIDCLDGFTGTLPSEFFMPQPEPLCDGDGNPNNISWFAFVAGSNSIDLSIIPSNCDTVYDNGLPATIGIQAAVYEDCSFEEGFICQTDGCFDLIAQTLNIASDQFVEGQVYYLLVDGCGGSICDYEVVVNSGQQAFEMDEITTISNNLNFDLEADTLCLGSEMTFTLDNFDQEANFNWIIDPPTSDYPTGIHPVIDTNSVTFQFSEPGCFDIHVYAFNECDNSETRTFSLCVEPLEDEYFSDIYVCQECFPITLIAPESGCIITQGGGAPTVLIEDPNGDGVPGWLGNSTIDGPGLDSNIVTNVLGCTYKQFVNVIEIPISPRENVDHYFCLEDFPVTIDGNIFNNPGDSRNITIEGGAASGCDSLMRITAHAIDFFGSSSIGNCEAGEVELAINVDNISVDEYDSIIYTWFDENGDVVTDSDGVDSILLVMGVGSYSVQVAVAVDGNSCSQTFGPFMIDVDNLAPALPTITYAPIDICVSELQAIIYTENQSLGEEYNWTFTPNMPFSLGLTSDTVYVDISNGQDFQFCVQAMNGCGSTGDICEEVNVVASPDSEFTFDAEICLDSFTRIEYTGTSMVSPNTIFSWDFDGGIIRNGMDADSGGPFEIEFPASGQYSISLRISEAGCNSILTMYDIVVFEPYVPPVIECERNIGSVTFSWDNTTVDYLDFEILSGQPFVATENSITVNDLDSEEEVSVSFLFNALDICEGTEVIENCTSLPCPDIELQISLSDQDICLESGMDVELNININDTSGEGSWESPFLYDDNMFSIEESGTGEHLISYTYRLGDCVITADTMLYVYPTPELETVVSLSYCEMMGSSKIDIITNTDNTVELDDEAVLRFEDVEVESGAHILTVTSPDGCSTMEEFFIETDGVEDLIIVGEENIVKGNMENYTASFVSDLEDLILIWTLDNDTTCVNCYDVNISPEQDAELCVSIAYGEGCFIEECLLIEITERTELYIPNAFSPNGDNVNDQFTIHSNNTMVFVEEIMIFDRWGAMVLNKKGFNVSEDVYYWDGTRNGDLCVEGVYVYVITYQDEEGSTKKITGDLTLVR